MSTYFERIDRNERREAEWRMLDSSLQQRRSHPFRRSLIATILWITGAHA